MKLAQALEGAGVQASNRGRRVGDWELGELLDESGSREAVRAELIAKGAPLLVEFSKVKATRA